MVDKKQQKVIVENREVIVFYKYKLAANTMSLLILTIPAGEKVITCYCFL